MRIIMSVDEKSDFVADGGDSVTTGYGTNSTSLAFGVNVSGNQVGVVGNGPTGVMGQGNNGPGGRFAATSATTFPEPPQVHLDPHLTGRPGATGQAMPIQFINPKGILPQVGIVGDMWFSNDPKATSVSKDASDKLLTIGAALWICVRASEGQVGRTGFQQAFWCQVLLGTAFQGQAVISNQ
jgi:hypothetical protein